MPQPVRQTGLSAPSMKDASTRERLIAAAFVVVARDGLEAASVKSIAAEAGVTSGLTHYHFPNKDALLEAALRQALDEYLDRVRARRAATRQEDQIEAFFVEARDTATKDTDFYRARLAFAVRALTHPPLAAILRELNGVAIAETALTFAAARGRDVAAARDLELAATLKGAFDGLMLSWLSNPAFPVEAAGDIMEAAARGWLADT